MAEQDGVAWIDWEAAFKHERDTVLGPGERASDLEALCLSGGGVRSAAYCLGVLQTLARAGQLSRFHYLSTVSGGGYIGAWLQTLIARMGVTGVMGLLRAGDAPEVRRLRRYTNWITPQVGVLSVDSWTGVAIYLRNVLLNWLVYAPIFMLGALVAVFMRSAFFQLQGARPVAFGSGRLVIPAEDVLGGQLMFAGPAVLLRLPGGLAVIWALLSFLAGIAGLLWAIIAAARSIPSRRKLKADGVCYLPEEAALWHIYRPSLAWAFLTPLGIAPVWAWMLHGPAAARWALPGVFMLTSIAGYVVAALTAVPRAPGDAAADYWPNLMPWTGASAAGAATLWSGLEIASRLPFERSAELVAVAGPAWLLLSYAVLSAVHAGLRAAPPRPRPPDVGLDMGDLDGEWMARLTALRLRSGLLWAAFAFCVLTLSRALVWNADVYPAWATVLVAGPLAAWVGKQAFTQFDALISGKSSLLKWELVLQLLSAAFALAVLAGAGFTLENALGPLQDWIGRWSSLGFGWRMVLAHLILAGFLALLLGVATWRIQVNRFSMHGVYRNRLVRAFLGPARPAPGDKQPGTVRHPDPLTEFDPADNPSLHTLHPDHREGPKDRVARRLLPVIGATLNLTGTRRTEWAERKAAPFTLTPLHCGAAHLLEKGRYVDTAAYSGTSRRGVTLGTAITVSGAAVSPNWGYHSSRLTAFLMTLFNVRLGAWLPNPAHLPKTGGGADALRLAMDELRGRTTDERAFVYLSDGGHFDNLGLYEMLRRQCRLVVVVDATQDGKSSFRDLGDALRKARIDLGAEVAFTYVAATGLGEGRITYASGVLGRLLLLKPALSEDAPADLLAYRAANGAFPHQSTAEQWFTEAQFESYRALGAHQAKALARHRALDGE